MRIARHRHRRPHLALCLERFLAAKQDAIPTTGEAANIAAALEVSGCSCQRRR